MRQLRVTLVSREQRGSQREKRPASAKRQTFYALTMALVWVVLALASGDEVGWFALVPAVAFCVQATMYARAWRRLIRGDSS